MIRTPAARAQAWELAETIGVRESLVWFRRMRAVTPHYPPLLCFLAAHDFAREVGQPIRGHIWDAEENI